MATYNCHFLLGFFDFSFDLVSPWRILSRSPDLPKREPPAVCFGPEITQIVSGVPGQGLKLALPSQMFFKKNGRLSQNPRPTG